MRTSFAVPDAEEIEFEATHWQLQIDAVVEVEEAISEIGLNGHLRTCGALSMLHMSPTLERGGVFSTGTTAHILREDATFAMVGCGKEFASGGRVAFQLSGLLLLVLFEQGRHILSHVRGRGFGVVAAAIGNVDALHGRDEWGERPRVVGLKVQFHGRAVHR